MESPNQPTEGESVWVNPDEDPEEVAVYNRSQVDALHQSVVNSITSLSEAGYLFSGVATSETNPGTPDAKVFYIANGKGAYEKFGGLEVTEDEVVVLYYDTAWHKVSTGIASQEKLSELGQEVADTETRINASQNALESRVNAEIDDFKNAVTDQVENYKPIVINGNVTNAADEEDITAENGLLKFKDRSSLNGMGYIILRKNKTFAEQVTRASTIYVIKYDFNLDEDITIPANCVLEFDGGSISGVHALIGQNTVINSMTTPIFDGIVIQGTWNNNASYLSWFADSDDYSEQIVYLSLLSKKIYLDKSGNLKGQSHIATEVEIDGCDNTFNIYINDNSVESSSYNTFYFNCSANVNMHNINLVYSQVLTNTQSRTYNCISVRNENIGNQATCLHNITIEGFDNRDSNPCQFNAILLQNFDEGNTCLVHDIYIRNCINLGDGIKGNNSGAIYGIRAQVSRSAKETGVGEIYNVYMNKIANCDPSDHSSLRFIEDCAAIYICAAPGIKDMHTPINIFVHNCHFEDIGERCFKIQGDNAVIKNIYSTITTTTVNNEEQILVEQDEIINDQGGYLTLENIYGDVSYGIASVYYGTCSIRNSHINKKFDDRSILFEMGANEIIIENCIFNIEGSNCRCVFYVKTDGTNIVMNNCTLSSIKNGLEQTPAFNLFASTSGETPLIVNMQINNSDISIYSLYENDSRGNLNFSAFNSNIKLYHFSYNLHGLKLIDSKATLSASVNLYFVSPNTEYYVNIINSTISFDANANVVIAFPSTTTIELKNAFFENRNATVSKNLTLKFNNGVKYAVIRNVRFNHLWFNEEQIIYDFSNGAGDILYERVRNNPINVERGFVITEDSNPINPLNISYNALQNPVNWYPYIITSTRVIDVPGLNFTGKDGVTYCYNNKNVYYRNGRWVDATGTIVK